MTEMGLQALEVYDVLTSAQSDYPAASYPGCRVATRDRLAVPYDPTTRTVITVLWNTAPLGGAAFERGAPSPWEGLEPQEPARPAPLREPGELRRLAGAVNPCRTVCAACFRIHRTVAAALRCDDETEEVLLPTPTKAHKAAMQRGREEARAVRDYLDSLGRTVPDPDVIDEKVEQIQAKIDAEPDTLKRLALVQRRLDKEAELARAERLPDPETLEREFVKAVAGYSERKGITYAAWREVGVPASVLKEAGLK